MTRRRRLARVFWIGAAAMLVVAALVALGSVLRGSFSETDGRILASLGALLYTGGAALTGLALVDRKRAEALGFATAGVASVTLVVTLLWIWIWTGENNDDNGRYAGSLLVITLAGLLATTALLLARRPAIERLAAAAGVLAAIGAALTLAAIWDENAGDTLGKFIAAAWIVAVLVWALVPVLQHLSSVGEAERPVRVLATLGDVELVASRHPVEGVQVEERPEAGERLVLRTKP